MCCLEVNVAPRDTGTMHLRWVRRPMQQTSKLGKGFWEYLAIWRFSISASWCLTIKEIVLVVGAICRGPSTYKYQALCWNRRAWTIRHYASQINAGLY